jgi:hypothetical protein
MLNLKTRFIHKYRDRGDCLQHILLTFVNGTPSLWVSIEIRPLEIVDRDPFHLTANDVCCARLHDENVLWQLHSRLSEFATHQFDLLQTSDWQTWQKVGHLFVGDFLSEFVRKLCWKNVMLVKWCSFSDGQPMKKLVCFAKIIIISLDCKLNNWIMFKRSGMTLKKC